ncbi:phage/plasmid primase, P4 family [Mycolicibacterium sp. XJ2]
MITDAEFDELHREVLDNIYRMLDLRAAAHRWADDGYAVFPVDRKTKRPLTAHSFRDATRDHDEIDRMWDQYPRGNVAAAVPVGQIVIDVDGYHGGLDTILGMLAEYGPLPPTKFHITGGDDGTGTSTHDFFTVDIDVSNRIAQRPLGPGVDIRVGGKGYVVVHGLHKSGRGYADMTPGITPAPLPHAWYDLIVKPHPKKSAIEDFSRLRTAGDNKEYVEHCVRDDLAKLAAATEGTRNDTLHAVACNLFEWVKGGHVNQGWAYGELESIAQQIGLGDSEIRSTLRQAWNRVGERHPPAPREISPAFQIGTHKADLVSETGTNDMDDDAAAELDIHHGPLGSGLDPADAHHGQARFAYRLAEREAGRLLHVHGLGWHCWDGTRWALDDRGAGKRAVLAMLRDQWRKGFSNKEVAAEVKRCQSAAAVGGILELAAALEPFAATVDDLDTDPYLLNVANGTLDLHTLVLRPHSPADRMTKACRAAYVPGTATPTWDAFLARVLTDDSVRGFVQRLAGMTLLGEVREHVLPIFTGTGRNGKSVLYKALLFALGDYAATADPELFMVRDGAHPTGEMDLMGKRLVVVSESNKDRRLDEAKMKRLVGGDPIKARHMRKDFVEFMPSHQAVLVTNHLPRVSGDDSATWARLRVVPFDVVIPPHEQDTDLDRKLQLEADGILSWAVDGLRDYLDRGLDEPASVRVATETYHHEMDAVTRFILECCDTGPNCRATSTELHQEWVRWQQQNGCDPMGLLTFGKALDKKGYTVKRTRRGADRAGLSIKPPPNDFDIVPSADGDECDESSGSTHRVRTYNNKDDNSSHSSRTSNGQVHQHPRLTGRGRCARCSYHVPSQGHCSECCGDEQTEGWGDS